MSTQARVAFYIAKNGNIIDKLIAWYTNSKYSHVELVCGGDWYSTSPRDLKVRKQQLIPKEGHWEFIDIDIDLIYLEEFFFLTKGRKYDWLGIFLSQFMPLKIHSERRYFCSEWVASALRIPNSNEYSPQDLYEYLKE